MATTISSTQILTTEITVQNDLKTHLTIEEKISRIFPGIRVHAVSSKYD
ncbi:12802_t:CDS:1, partial [Acaulospora morrowiae]